MPPWNGIIERIRPKAYSRKQPLVLVNGLAEQAESWYKNRRYWGRFFDIQMPNFLVYEGDALHQRIAAGEPISVDYLVGQLHTFLHQFVQTPPYHFVASSLGGKVVVEFAARYPNLVNRLVLLCPSGMGDEEQLPVMQGVRRSDWNSVVRSVFHRRRYVDRGVVRYYQTKMQSRRWKTGMLRTIRGTLEHTVRERLKDVKAPTLFVTGLQDRICDPATAGEAARELPNGFFRAIKGCGHAPQIEKYRLINRLVTYFLSTPRPTAHPPWTQLITVKPTRESK